MNPTAVSVDPAERIKKALLRRQTGLENFSFLPTFKTAQDVLDFSKEHQCTVLDLTFVDVPGTLQRTSKPIHQLEEVLQEGAGFDGSSIRGFQQIEESDMLLIPDVTTAYLDPFSDEPTLSLLCDVRDPFSTELYSRSPRTIARKAVDYLLSTGIADKSFIGPEAEFFLFDHVDFDAGAGHAHYSVDSEEAAWNTGDGDRIDRRNMGYKIRHKEGYFPAAPFDRHQNVRAEMVLEMEKAGIKVETFHHEVATGGQAEIDMVFDELLPMADKIIRYKYIVRNVAARYGKTATFMPKPLYGDNGSGMHTHQSLWKEGGPLFAGDKYAGMSEMALHYMGGILKHAPALLALTNPTTNSYKRLVPGFEAPVNFIYSARNRSAAIRIPTYSQSPKSKRMEFRSPDASCNPYLAFAAMLLAGIDGIKKQIDPGNATDQNLYDMTDDELSSIPRAPRNLNEALDALENDMEFLTAPGVFEKQFIQDYIHGKRDEAMDEARRPTAGEFARYFDV